MGKVVIIDYGMGNIHSVKRACKKVGISVLLTSDKATIEESDAIILPGVGAFKDAMRALVSLDLVDTIKESAEIGKPIIGICLGMQLLLTSSEEFGKFHGLNLIEGKAMKFKNSILAGKILKVPQIGWNTISKKNNCPVLQNLPNNVYMYFIHSYFAKLENPEEILTYSTYGGQKYVSSLRKKNIYGFQFHPEKSANNGLLLWQGIKEIINNECRK